MTVLGKILVFVNLVFSVVVGGLVVVVFTARTNYAVALQAEKDQRKLDQGAVQAKIREVDQLRIDLKKENTDLAGKLAKLEAELATQVAVNASIRDKIGSEVGDDAKENAIKTAVKREVDVARAGEQAMKKRFEDAVEKNTALVKENSRLTQDTLTAQIEAKSLQERLDNLEKQYKYFVANYAKNGGNSGGQVGAPGGPPKNPPAEKIEGQVVKMNAGLLQLSAGSDAGLKVGHTLELFRLDPKPQYLGLVRITDIEAKVAVAVPVGKLLAEPQAGDQFASQIK